MRLALAPIAYADEIMLAAVADREDVVATYKDVDFSDVQFLIHHFDQVQDRKEGFAVLVHFRTLVALLRIFNRQFVQAELKPHLLELLLGCIFKSHPYKAVRADDVVVNILDRDVGKLATVLIGNAVDQHGNFPVTRACRASTICLATRYGGLTRSWRGSVRPRRIHRSRTCDDTRRR